MIGDPIGIWTFVRRPWSTRSSLHASASIPSRRWLAPGCTRRRHLHRTAAVLLFALVVCCTAAPRWVVAGETASLESESLRFRRVFVPADRLNQLPRDNTRYVPINKGEFEALVERVRLDAAMSPGNMPQAVIGARYTARLIDDSLAEGEAVLDVRLPDASVSMLWLAPCGIAIGEAAWLGEHPQPATLAVNEDGQVGVRSPRDGKLQLKWSLRGQRGTWRDIEFHFELPACPSSHMAIVLPKGLAPLVDRAVVLKDGPATDGAERWRIELGGQHRFSMRLIPSEDLAGDRKHNVLRQALTYEFSLRGVDVSAQWTLDVPAAPLRQLAVDLDPALQLVAARYAGQPVHWSTAGSAAAHGGTRVVIELPEAVRGSGKVLGLGAVTMPVLGNRWRLPTMRPQGVFWQEGTTTLVVPSPLTLDALTVQGGRQTQTGPLPPPQSGQIAEFQCFSPNASIDVRLARPESPLEFDCGTALELSGVDMAAEATARFRVAEGERFSIEADVSRLWTVDSVETVPANALEDWSVLQGEGGGRRLSIRLAKALDAAGPLKISVQARHHYSPLGRELTRDDLVPIEFHGSGGGRRLVSTRAAEAYQLRVSHDERFTRVDPKSLSPADLELFDDPPKGLVFVDDEHAATVQVALQPHKPSYSATVAVEAAATATGLNESYTMRCVPETTRVDRVLVQFSHARSTPLHWSFGPDEQDQVTVRTWKPKGFPTDGETSRGEEYEIVFRRPRTAPFEFRATRTLPLLSPLALSLAALPEAARQSGTVSISSMRAGAIQIQSHHLTSIPPAATPGDQYSAVRATFRYDPTHDAVPGADAGVVLTPQKTESAVPSAWAWSCNIESRFTAEGKAHHLIVYRLENAGRARILLGLPADLDSDAICGIWVDGSRVPRDVIPGGEGLWLAVSLPAGRRYPSLSLLVSSARPSPGILDSLEPVVPQLDVPVLRSYWTAWLPPGYRLGWSPWSGECLRNAPQSLPQRLFGAFGQGERSARFRPWMAEDWTHWDGTRNEVAFARHQGERLLDQLGSRAKPSAVVSGTGSLNPALPDPVWGERLLQAATSVSCPVLVDHVALARCGIRAQSPLPQVHGETDPDRGPAIAEQADLSVLVSRDAVLLTSAVGTASYRACLAPTGLDSVWQVLPGVLADRLIQAAEGGQDPTFVRLEVWGRMPDPPSDPWTLPMPTGPSPSESLSGSSFGMELPSEGSAVLPIVHAETIQGLGWSMFVAVFALLMWKGRARSSLLVVLATLAALGALLIPDAFAPIPAGVLWAVLAATGLKFVTRQQRSVAGRADSTITTQRRLHRSPAVRTTVWALFTICTWCGSVRGESADGPTLAPAQQVLIPVDEKQQPTGDKFYVPESFFSRLQSAAAGRVEDRQGWVLRSAVYRGTLTWRSAPEQLALEELRASFEIEVFGRQTRVRIAMGRTGMEPLPDGVTLEGRSIQPIWPDAEGYMAFDVVEPGRYRLELAARPTTRTVGEKIFVQWKIPRLATSRLELTIPPDAPSVEFPFALGATVREPDPARLRVALGPTDRLEIDWPERASRSAGGTTADVEQLLWLKIRPGSVVLETLLNFRGMESGSRQIELAVDPRLRYFPAKDERSPIAQVSADPGEPQRIRFELSRPAGDRITIPATFLYQESSGVGNYRLPWFDVPSARTSKRWLAVSVDPSLEHSLAAERLQPVAVPAFVAAWGATKSPPLAAWEVPSPQTDWSVSTRPIPTQVKAHQTLTLNLAARCAHVILDAGIESTGEAVFQHQIAAPADLHIERISVLEDGAQRVSRWSRAADGVTTVFLNGPSTGKRQLTLVGRLPTPQPGRLPLPVIRLEAEPTRPMQIALFREPEVQVRVSEPTGLAEIEWPLADESRAPLGQLVKAFEAKSAEKVKADLWIAPNKPKVTADVITWMRSLADSWQLDLEYHLKVSGGLADQFQIEVPASWAGPHRVQPAATVKVVDVPGMATRRLVIKPRTAVEGEYRLGISGPLKVAAGERPSVVKPVLADAVVARHVLILPVHAQAPVMSWETHGLAPIPFPNELAVPAAARESFAAYRVTGGEYQALLRTGEEGQGKPQVGLTAVRIACHTDGTYHALASLDLEPGGLAACRVALPSACRLVQIAVAEHSAMATATEDDRWQIPLGSSVLPQRIEILYTGLTPDPNHNRVREFAVPMLDGIPVRQCVWTVAAPNGDPVRAGDSLTSLTPIQHALAGLRNEAALVERVAELPGVEGEALGRWYRGWASRWVAARARVMRQLVRLEAVSDTASVRAEVESLDKRQSAASQRLGLAALLSEAAGQVPREDLPAIGLSGEEARRAAIEYGAVSIPAPIAVVFEQAASPHATRRLLAALAVAVLGSFAAWGTSLGVIPTFLHRWPYGVAVAIGLGWWCFLEPSAVGCGLAMIAAAGGFWSNWRRRMSVAPGALRLPR